jgi:predicted transcriptional regulator of viral defense system
MNKNKFIIINIIFCFYIALYLQHNRNIIKEMSFLEFKNKMFDLACFNIHQIYAWQPGFDRNNLTRWVKKGYLIRLRQGYFAFSEYKNKPDYSLYFANRIYRPSYISLHSALAFYGIIPETVIQITSVTSLKTESFSNDFGEYSYKSIKENLMFGYELKPMADNRTVQYATPEKALLDLLYLYPFYDNKQELEELRLDEDYLHKDLNKDLLTDYCAKFHSKALDHRIKLLCNTYDI